MSDNTLAGFDLVYAITQELINDQIAYLSVVEEKIATTWKAYLNIDAPADPPFVDATLGIPVVSLLTGDSSSRKVKLRIPFADGTFAYWKLNYQKKIHGVPTAERAEAQLAGSALTLTANLSLAELAPQLEQKLGRVPQHVLDQLTKFDESMFEIQHLFLNFEDADLIDSYELEAGGAKDLNAPEVIDQFKDVLKSYIEGLKGSSNPFILGYIAQARTHDSDAGGAQVPDFAPTGVTYSITPEPETPPRSSLNYLLVTGNKKVLGAGYGIFTDNWVSRDDASGAFVISEPLLAAKITPGLAAACGPTATLQRSASGYALEVANNNGGVNRCAMRYVPGTAQIVADYTTTFSESKHDRAGSYIGYIDGNVSWSSTISFSINADNNLALAITTTTPKSWSAEHPNSLGDFEKILADAASAITEGLTLGYVKDACDYLINGDWQQDFQLALGDLSTVLKQNIILPARTKIFFKDPVFTPEGHLVLTSTVKN
jgi:hypothetical protein